MQNRSTGAGVTPTRNRNINESVLEPNPSPHSNMGHMQPQYMLPQPNFQPGQFNPYPNMYMNTMGAGLSNSLPDTSSLNNAFIPPFLPLPPGVNPQAFNGMQEGNRGLNQMQFNSNSPDYHNQRNTGSRNRERDHRHNGYSDYNRGEDRNRMRDDRSRSHDRSRSRYDNHDRRRR